MAGTVYSSNGTPHNSDNKQITSTHNYMYESQQMMMRWKRTQTKSLHWTQQRLCTVKAIKAMYVTQHYRQTSTRLNNLQGISK